MSPQEIESLARMRELIGSSKPGDGEKHFARLTALSESAVSHDAFFDKYPVSDLSNLMRFYAVGKINDLKVEPVFKMVDTCAGEFESRTPYFYGTFEDENDADQFQV